MDLNKHVLPPAHSVGTFHSNGFAQMSNGDRVGAASKETFMQRRQIDTGRRVVGNYRFSNMGRNLACLKAQPSIPRQQNEAPITPIIPNDQV